MAAADGNRASNPPLTLRVQSWWRYALLVACLGPALFFIDVPAARWFERHPPRGDLADGVQIAEFFGHGIGVALLLVVIAVLDPPGRVTLPRIAASSLGAGLLANVIKMALERSRPSSLDLDAVGVWNTFGDWAPLWAHAPSVQGFPSGHTATAAGLAVALTACYPHGRRLFLALCVGVAAQRMAVLAHFPSDVFFGGLLGAAWGWRCQTGWIGRQFDRLEARLRRGPGAPQVESGEASRTNVA